MPWRGRCRLWRERRPDLVALQLGYRAQNAKLRTAILSRFPNLMFGVTGGSDNANVRNFGPQITLELPIFNQNQGNIAIETATRQQLHDEYAARLTAAFGQVRAMMAEIELLSRQLEAVRRDLPAPVVSPRRRRPHSRPAISTSAATSIWLPPASPRSRRS